MAKVPDSLLVSSRLMKEPLAVGTPEIIPVVELIEENSSLSRLYLALLQLAELSLQEKLLVPMIESMLLFVV